MNLLVILYFVNFIRTILIIVIIYFGIRLFTRYVLPLIVDKRCEKHAAKNARPAKTKPAHRPQRR